jgi:hypothetical protein
MSKVVDLKKEHKIFTKYWVGDSFYEVDRNCIKCYIVRGISIDGDNISYNCTCSTLSTMGKSPGNITATIAVGSEDRYLDSLDYSIAEFSKRVIEDVTAFFKDAAEKARVA